MQAQPEPEFEIEVDGQMTSGKEGDTIAALLLRAGISTFGHAQSGKPRGLFCGMGVCFDCLVTVDGLPGQRACITPARPGMCVHTDRARVR